MKVFTIVAASILVLVGCGKSGGTDQKATNESSSPLTAPVDYLGALEKGKVAAEKTVDIASINKAIQMFSIENGRNPKDLKELVDEKFLPMLPKAPYGMELKYDAASGKVTVVQSPKP